MIVNYLADLHFFRVKVRLYGLLHLAETYPAYKQVHFTTFHLRVSM
jgi:hypothetical protein